LSRAGIDAEQRLAHRAVAAVFPFRTNTYVVDELIDWTAAPDDPIFRLTFPQPGMLAVADLERMTRLLRADATPEQVRAAANEVRRRLNPHPAGQVTLNEPTHDGRRLAGMQHKYAETLLVLPRPGQTCHAYCQYCFRWPQFVGEPEFKLATDNVDSMVGYLSEHPEISDVLLTGGDPMVMAADVLRRYIEPLLAVDTVDTVRISTKALSYWPQRFVTDPDADALLRLLEQVTAAGRQLAVMVHVSHPRELDPPLVAMALRQVRDTGAVLRFQAPVIRGINDDAAVWATMWRRLTALGVVPYYMFVERDTGPHDFFAVPLERAYTIYRDAISAVSGLARTARGPVLSTTSGKVCVDGIATIGGERVFVLRYLQARDPAIVGRPFFAQFDAAATWLTDLKPAFGASELGPQPT